MRLSSSLCQSVIPLATLVTLIAPLAANATELSVESVVDFATLCDFAEARSESAFQPAPELPNDLKPLDYDDYRLVSFWPNEAIWRRADTPFQLELFHRGYIFFERVGINLIEDGAVRPVPFDSKLYEYRGKLYDKLAIPPETGYAGVKMLGTLPSSPYMQEVTSFIGASYFRSLSDGQVYGASSRGLGLKMGMNEPEEFPCFREFWIFKPATDDNINGDFDGEPGTGKLHFLAFLDSPSLTGAYEFQLDPGAATSCEVRARLFYRYPVSKLCIAPTSSMWMWGKGRSAPNGEARPEVHDSDGLLIRDGHNDEASNEQTWRMLAKQSYPSVSSNAVHHLSGFGLMQRERNYDRYQDDEAKYHVRPSLWVEPLDENGEATTWSDGWVELFEMPADNEGYDNIASWYVPKTHGKPGKPFDLHYRVTFLGEDPAGTTVATVSDMVMERDEATTFVELVFEGVENVENLNNHELVSTSDDDGSDVGLTADVSALRGSITSITLGSPSNDRITLRLGFRPDGDAPVELRASVRKGDKQLTETWSYLCPPSN